ncbi:hypothetical protein ARALYDRAFT_888164 [Arabidopsis lyrata subsp. lyrata]|uniref:S-protein homolog n=1 Tax=Arabidopsis lyrata subsp. lyrata TaxID=81972 RepID=D7KJN1_ARALL|nr:hypothetical protein ARALYDRAFT_888164 [Arabidopsis lyrata subsp. lyrata]
MFPCPSNEIRISNELGPGLVLQYHCHSRDNNLGVQNLQFKELKQIRFGDKLGRRTRWTCLLKHGLYMRYYQEFIAYRMGNVRRCGAIRHWFARKDGIYLMRNMHPPPTFHHMHGIKLSNVDDNDIFSSVNILDNIWL